MRNSWVELDLAVLRANIRAVQSALADDATLMFVVKSNAYGHGVRAVSATAWQCGVRWYAVADVTEALELRAALPKAEILVLGGIWPDDVARASAANIVTGLIDERQALGLAAAARQAGRPLRCHAKIDTGMGRVGFAWATAPAELARVAGQRELRLEGAFMHFASADREESDFPDCQAQRFQDVVAACRRQGLDLPFLHMANSGAFLRKQEWDLSAVRPGILLYGYGPRLSSPRCVTRPFLEWKARIVQVKDVPPAFPVGYDSTHVTPAATRIATLPVGYADGYPRLLGNAAQVIVHGHLCPVVGRVSMNYITVDVGAAGTVAPGDEVVLLGQQGGEALWADRLAQWCHTIAYEILTGIRSPLLVQRGAGE